MSEQRKAAMARQMRVNAMLQVVPVGRFYERGGMSNSMRNVNSEQSV